LEAVGDGLMTSDGSHAEYSMEPNRRLKLMDRLVKETGVRSAV
jgi:hypothetical protein